MRRISFLLTCAILAISGCGSSSDQASGAKAPTSEGSFDNAGVGGTGASGIPAGQSGAAGGATVPAIAPPEKEVKLGFEQPQASDRFVYAANPESGTVSIIDAQTLAIQTLETGDRPTFLRTLAGTDDAIVLNVGSQDATILRSPSTGAKTSTVKVTPGANVIAVAPDGKHAVVYFDATYSTAGGTPGSFQDVTVIALDTAGDTASGMTVGFRPRDVFFSADGKQAFVVTDDGISVLDFVSITKNGSGIARRIALADDVDQKGLDVSVTPDGRYALSRQPGKSVLRLVDLTNGKIQALELADVLAALNQPSDEDAGVVTPSAVDVTDLDLAASGAFALAVLRNQSTVLRVPIPEAFEDPTKVSEYVVKGEFIGSVTIAPKSDLALLYTTAVDVKRITILPLDSSDPARTVALRKTISAVAIAPDGETSLIIHKKADGDPNQVGIDPDVKLDRSYGYSVLRSSTGDVKLQVTSTPPIAFSIVPDGSYLFLLFRADPSVREVQKIEAKSFLVTPIELGSPPVSIGTVPKSERVFVNQEHPDGRITFIDYKTDEQPRTVTGFALNSRIRD